MHKIVIISSSIRFGRNSHRVAQFLYNYIVERSLADIEILDLKECNFPIFEERLRSLPDPSPAVLEVSGKIKKADGVIIVTPEYNGGYPASLKNLIDLLLDEWKRKPIAVATVSKGQFGGAHVITSLVFCLWKIGAIVVPATFAVAKVETAYDANGSPANKEVSDSIAKSFAGELLWCIEATSCMKISAQMQTTGTEA